MRQKASTTRGSNWRAGAAAQLGQSLLDGDRVAVGAVAHHRHEGRADRDDRRRDAGSPRRSARRGSRRRRSARGASGSGRRCGRARAPTATIRAPISGWVRITSHSCSSSAPGLARIESGIASLPTSCSRAASSTRSTSRWSSPSARAVSLARWPMRLRSSSTPGSCSLSTFSSRPRHSRVWRGGCSWGGGGRGLTSAG